MTRMFLNSPNILRNIASVSTVSWNPASRPFVVLETMS